MWSNRILAYYRCSRFVAFSKIYNFKLWVNAQCDFMTHIWLLFYVLFILTCILIKFTVVYKKIIFIKLSISIKYYDVLLLLIYIFVIIDKYMSFLFCRICSCGIKIFIIFNLIFLSFKINFKLHDEQIKPIYS